MSDSRKIKKQKITKVECVVCYETTEEKLVCGHMIHMACIKQQFKAECPLCRTKLDVVVHGREPEDPNHSYIPPNHDEIDGDEWEEVPQDVLLSEFQQIYNLLETNPHHNTMTHMNNETGLDSEYNEEHPDYDEENPTGDTVDYPDNDPDETEEEEDSEEESENET